MNANKYPERRLKHLISGPFTLMMIVPTVITDIFLELFQHICFPLYNIPLVKRKNYIRIDRHKLKYLSYLDKFNCSFCGYTNGVAAYSVKIAGDAEKYWCGIKHQKTKVFEEPEHHKEFVGYNDKEEFKKRFS